MEQRRSVPLLAALAVACLAFGLTAGLPPASAQEADEAMAQGQMSDQAAMADDDMVIDVELCAACHDDLVADFSGPHAALDREGMDERYDITVSCSACHGDPTTHLEEGGGLGNIFSFNADVPHTVQAGKCMECHGDSHPGYLRSPHAMAGMSCQSCHGVHTNDGSPAMLKADAGTITSPMERIGAASAMCSECHGAVFTQFEFNERHRLSEGILDCQSCHDPHDAQTIAQLGGFKQESCVDCHGDKGGPFIFEHASSRVDGCVACHVPHGSPNRHMLKFQSVAELCYSCHAVVPGFHSRFTLDTQCTNCHSTIHGSNFDEAFLK